MHSIVMPPSPAILTIFFFIASPTPCCPFWPLTPLQSPLRKMRYPDAEISKVPSLLVSCISMTSQPFAAQVLNRVSMYPIPLTPLTAAVRTLNVRNVSSSSRDLALVAVFLANGLPLRPLPPSLFSSKCPSPFAQFLQVFPTQVLPFLLPTCWVRHSHHTSTSPSSTLSLTRVCPPSIPPLLASGSTFSAAAMSQLCYRRHDCRGKRFRFVGVHRRQSMLLAGLHCQYRRVLASIDVMKEHWFMRELYSWGGLTVGSPSAPARRGCYQSNNRVDRLSYDVRF